MTNILKNGVLAKAFPSEANSVKPKRFLLDVLLSENNAAVFSSKYKFEKAGMMIDRQIITSNYRPGYRGNFKTLSDVLVKPYDVPESFYIADSDIEKWRNKRARLSKHSKPNKSKFRGGRMRFPDRVDLPSRTIMTQEGGRSPSWHTHVILTAEGRYRRLLPIELSGLICFPIIIPRVLSTLIVPF